MKVLQLRGPSARAYLPGALQKKLCPQILRGLLWLWIASVKKGKTISRPSHRPDWRRDCCSLGLTACAHPRLSISAPKWTCRRCRNESGLGSKENESALASGSYFSSFVLTHRSFQMLINATARNGIRVYLLSKWGSSTSTGTGGRTDGDDGNFSLLMYPEE